MMKRSNYSSSYSSNRPATRNFSSSRPMYPSGGGGSWSSLQSKSSSPAPPKTFAWKPVQSQQPPAFQPSKTTATKPTTYQAGGFRPFGGSMFGPPGVQKAPVRPQPTVTRPPVVWQTMQPRTSVPESKPEELSVPIDTPRPQEPKADVPVIDLTQSPATPRSRLVITGSIPEEPKTIRPAETEVKIVRTVRASFEELFPGRLKDPASETQAKIFRSLTGMQRVQPKEPAARRIVETIPPPPRESFLSPPALEVAPPPPRHVVPLVARTPLPSMDTLRILAERHDLGPLQEWNYKMKSGRYVAR